MAVIQSRIEKDDLLTRLRVREVALFGLIGLTAVLANLPVEYTRRLGIDHEYLLGILASVMVVGLFLYLRFFLFFAVALLILGANLPDQIAEGFGVSKIPLILALVAMVGVSAINYVVKVLPTGLEPKPKEKSPEGVRAMFYAIEKNNVLYAQKVLSMRFDPNLPNGADPAQSTREGETPVELALRAGHEGVADLLKRARLEREAALAARGGRGDNTV
jgi:hypothetical protein